MTEQQLPTQFELIAPDNGAGVYANMLSVWHTPHEFTLDFAVPLPGGVGEDENGNQVVRVPCQVVSRVRIPPTVVFDVLRALSENLGHYEKAYGDIRRPGESPDQISDPPPG